MSTALVDITYELIDAIYTALENKVIFGGVTYPVYKSIPKPSASIYVHIHDVLHSENGTKEAFIYEGSVIVEIVNENMTRPDRKLLASITSVVRGLLKPTKAAVLTMGGSLTMIVFSFGVHNEFTEQADKGISRTRYIDSYNFIIE